MDVIDKGRELLVTTEAGRIHLVYELEDGRRLTDERCNLDDSPATRELDIGATQSFAVDRRKLCRRCFPKGAL